MVKGKEPAVCPVCWKKAGSGTFLCTGCEPNAWVHPKCGGYSKVAVQTAAKSEVQDNLRCNNCKVIFLILLFLVSLSPGEKQVSAAYSAATHQGPPIDTYLGPKILLSALHKYTIQHCTIRK